MSSDIIKLKYEIILTLGFSSLCHEDSRSNPTMHQMLTGFSHGQARRQPSSVEHGAIEKVCY